MRWAKPWTAALLAGVTLFVVGGGLWWWAGRTSQPALRASESGPAGAAGSREGPRPAAALGNLPPEEGRRLLRLSQEAGVVAVPVRRMDIQRYVEATGFLVAAREQSLRFGIGGQVSTVAVAEGQLVKAGQVLAALNDTDQQLAYVRARSDYETARLEQGAAQVEEKRLALEVARRSLEATRLVAPFDGVVARLSVRPGDQVSASQEAVWLIDPASLEAQVAVDEVDLAYVKVGQPVTITVKTFPDLQFSGRVERLAVAGRTQGDVVLFDVTVRLDPLDPRLRPGMSATARIEVERAQGVLAVPEEAVAEVNGRAFVSRVVDGQLVPTLVTLGVSDGRWVEVRTGLQDGDRVLATNYAVYQRLAGSQGGPSGPSGTNPFSFRLSPGRPFPGGPGGEGFRRP